MISQSQAPVMDPDKGRNQPHSETQSVPSSKPTRRFKEAEMIADSKPATSSLISKPDSLDEKSEFEPQHSGTTNDHTHQPTLTSTKTKVVTNEHRSNHGDSEVMKPPSLPPPSMIKDAKIMPPPSLPGRKVKGETNTLCWFCVIIYIMCKCVNVFSHRCTCTYVKLKCIIMYVVTSTGLSLP